MAAVDHVRSATLTLLLVVVQEVLNIWQPPVPHREDSTAFVDLPLACEKRGTLGVKVALGVTFGIPCDEPKGVNALGAATCRMSPLSHVTASGFAGLESLRGTKWGEAQSHFCCHDP